MSEADSTDMNAKVALPMDLLTENTWDSTKIQVQNYSGEYWKRIDLLDFQRLIGYNPLRTDLYANNGQYWEQIELKEYLQLCIDSYSEQLRNLEEMEGIDSGRGSDYGCEHEYQRQCSENKLRPDTPTSGLKDRLPQWGNNLAVDETFIAICRDSESYARQYNELLLKVREAQDVVHEMMEIDRFDSLLERPMDYKFMCILTGHGNDRQILRRKAKEDSWRDELEFVGEGNQGFRWFCWIFPVYTENYIDGMPTTSEGWKEFKEQWFKAINDYHEAYNEFVEETVINNPKVNYESLAVSRPSDIEIGDAVVYKLPQNNQYRTGQIIDLIKTEKRYHNHQQKSMNVIHWLIKDLDTAAVVVVKHSEVAPRSWNVLRIHNRDMDVPPLARFVQLNTEHMPSIYKNYSLTSTFEDFEHNKVDAMGAMDLPMFECEFVRKLARNNGFEFRITKKINETGVISTVDPGLEPIGATRGIPSQSEDGEE